MIILIILFIICIFALIRNAYVYNMGIKIDDMIHRYHINMIDNNMEEFVFIDSSADYEQFNYKEVFLKFWIWDWRKTIPNELVKRIEPFEQDVKQI